MFITFVLNLVKCEFVRTSALNIFYMIRCRPTWRTPQSTTSSRLRGSRWSSTSPPLWATWPLLRPLVCPLCHSPVQPLKPLLPPAAPQTVLWLCLISDPTRRKYGKFLLSYNWFNFSCVGLVCFYSRLHNLVSSCLSANLSCFFGEVECLTLHSLPA